MDDSNKDKFDKVIEELKNVSSVVDFNSKVPIGVQMLEEINRRNMMSDVIDKMTRKRPMIACGVVDDMLKDIREKMGHDVGERMQLIFNLLGDSEEEQSQKYNSLPCYIKWAFKAFIWLSACLEKIAFGAEKLYKKVRDWIIAFNNKLGLDNFVIPEQLPTIKEAKQLFDNRESIKDEIIEYLTVA